MRVGSDMASKICAFGFVLCFALASTNPVSKIVGGQDADIIDYPSLVQVEFYALVGVWGQSCAANILTSRYILSAAHCFEGPLYHHSYRRIRAGSSARASGGTVYWIEQEFNHPSYGLIGADGDITVVRMEGSIAFNEVVQPGAIVSQGTVLPDNVPVVHAGWGTTTQGGSPASVLQDVTINTINHELCRDRYLTIGDIVTTNMICAGILDVGGKDACQGDSGGPLYYNVGGINAIVGIVSTGEGCADATFPGISTAVGSYTNWILSIVQ